MNSQFTITTLANEPQVVLALADILMEVVANGGSVSFMHPLSPEVATAFWETSLAAAARGERLVLGALADGKIIGTVTLLLDSPPNQPHRAEIAKMMTRLSHRGQGVARSLLLVAEGLALDHGRTLLTLDTAAEEGAAGFYEKLGYQKGGLIPDYALKPHGGLTGTVIYYKRML